MQPDDLYDCFAIKLSHLVLLDRERNGKPSGCTAILQPLVWGADTTLTITILKNPDPEDDACVTVGHKG